jgi:Fe-Mn family superoxide dismutase
MLRLSKNLVRPDFIRAFRAPASYNGVHTLPDLPYQYDVRLFISAKLLLISGSTFLPQALEPHISKEIMTLHHKKHHQTYVNGLNAAEESLANAQSPKERIVLQPALRFNGGGMWS